MRAGPLNDAIAEIRGKPGTVVKLGVGREPLPEPLEFSIVRAMVSVHSVRHEMLEPGIGYLRISQFSETTGADTESAVLALEEQAGGRLRGLVLDLRNNPGGVLDAAVEVSDFFPSAARSSRRKGARKSRASAWRRWRAISRAAPRSRCW